MDTHDKFILKNNGEEIKKARICRGMSRLNLADLCGLLLNTIAVIERGEHDLNGLSQARIFAALGCVGIKIFEDRVILHLSDKKSDFCRDDILNVPNSQKVSMMGAIVRQRRVTLGMSLEKLASLVNCHKNTLWNFELGLTSPSGLMIHHICFALSVTEVLASPEGLILI